jgi:exopolysaccharide biosynthesis polyprenyl glycosylphosphotransferase
MNKQNRKIRKIVLWGADFIVTIISFVIALMLRYGEKVMFPESGLDIRYGRVYFFPRANLLVLIIAILMLTVISFIGDINSNFMGRSFWKELVSDIETNTIMAASLTVVTFMYQNSAAVSRLMVGYFYVMNTIFFLISHLIIKSVADSVFSKDNVKRRIIIITDTNNYKDVLNNFVTGYSYTVVGSLIATNSSIHGKVEDKAIDAGSGEIPNEIVVTAFDDLFLNIPTLSSERKENIINAFADMGVRVHIAVDLPVAMGRTTSLSDFGGKYYCVNYSTKVISMGSLAMKRIVDIIGSIVGLAITGIIFIILGPIIKMDSPGPIFFSQVRVGKNGRRFKIYKFRSMYKDAEQRKKDLMAKNQMQGLMFKMDNDPRITKVGAFIRKTSLDEFPQFLNVFKGDMSLVGTRPPTEKEFLQYNSYYRSRLMMKPGLTGLWQVSGRSDITDFNEVVKLDRQYIYNWSLKNDFKIIFKTVGVLFNHDGAK